MLILKGRQRAMLVDKLPDGANLAMGALVFGQLLGQDGFSAAIATLGMAIWALCCDSCRRSRVMTGLVILLGGMAAFAIVVTTLDWIGRRQLRKKSGDHAAPRA